MQRIVMWALIFVIVAFAGFTPIWVANQNAKHSLEVQCDSARFNIAELAATELTLQAELEIARSLNLPVARDIAEALETYPHPEEPEECVKLRSSQ